MASYIILLVAYLASFNINAVEYNSKIKCSNGACEKKETFKEITGPDLKIEKLAAGQCLLDADKNIFYRIESVDLSTKKNRTNFRDKGRTCNNHYEERYGLFRL